MHVEIPGMKGDAGTANRYLTRRLLIGLWLYAMLSAAVATENNPSSAASLEQARQLEELRERIRTVRAGLDTALERQDVLQGQLRDTEQATGRVLRQLRELEDQRLQQEAKLKALQEQRRGQQAALTTHRRALAQQVRAAYAIGRQEYLKVLLNQEEPASVGRALVYYDYFNRARAAHIQALKQSLAELAPVELAIRRQSEALRALSAERLRYKQTLEANRDVRKRLLAQLDAEIKDKGEILSRLQEDESRLEQLLMEVYEVLADITSDPGTRHPFITLKGQLPWPLKGRIKVAFGSRTRLGGPPMQGVLIAARPGQEVRSISHGRIAYADWLRGFGLLLIIDHGDGYLSLYGHNESLFKDVGEWVDVGEVVATTTGNTGGYSPSGLYFGIRHDGKPVDPVVWCEARRWQ